ncbi:riboflavin synthase subunit alpha [Thalassotalea euphylliae]|uniref:riboflavin synthase subunit alpha n=1 Tax=Thalassotalea euphylliae TaxID=1655234 RepID=UPI003631359D
MFTGIVQAKAKILSTTINNEICRLVIQVNSENAEQIELGASISINGTCLTVVSVDDAEENQASIAFDVIDETLRVTNLGALKEGDFVNFERSLKVGDEIGGHQVSGHVHTIASAHSIVNNADNVAITFICQGNWNKYLVEKGFISINGTSLTIGNVEGSMFSVHLIPETLERTNIGLLDIGDNVNIEFDQQTMTIVETIERMKLKLA